MSLSGGIVFSRRLRFSLYTMTSLDGKYAQSCRFHFFTTKNHQRNLAKNGVRIIKMESKHLFANGNMVIFGCMEGVFEAGFFGCVVTRFVPTGKTLSG
ncbi:hypothetical protein Mlab_0973 [Methanocorpusculum labreanum Z]|uniref:Uncharacterized protein n=1 Tax=Methanocorpusculum labreanum (strain ATCC 43576 / DSM 4855 / Z) TaxID=410358 RepID=A2SS37_METLZ|nr:hypothetical protein Mlab_0973 [Methanocorpusculum labreanum Z]